MLPNRMFEIKLLVSMSMNNVRRKKRTWNGQMWLLACGGKSALYRFVLLAWWVLTMSAVYFPSLSFRLSLFILFSLRLIFWNALEPLDRKRLTNIAYFQFNILFVCVNRFESICHLLSLGCVHRSAYYVTHFAATHSLNLNHTLLVTFSIYPKKKQRARRENEM